MKARALSQILVVALLLVTNSGCYYMQAARGHLEVINKREPIEDIVQDPGTPEELSRRLLLIQDARQFSIDELKLPDNDSYRSYTDLERDFVLWNVFAAPEFSLNPKLWCYPIVGCLAYRGYFSEATAHREAAKLSDKGFDVAVGGVAAYSTLGSFDDPVLNTMMRWGDIQLVTTLFHELAHQVLYIKDDTGFNESFATAVEEIGIERWLGENGRKGDMTRYRENKNLQRQLFGLVETARQELHEHYSSDIDDDRKRELKQALYEQLAADVRELLQRYGRNTEHWLTRDPNNARLVPMALYEARVPAFRALFVQCEFDMTCFFTEAIAISELEKSERDARLDRLESSTNDSPEIHQ